MSAAPVQRRRKILIVSGEPVTLVRFRRPLIDELVRDGWQVVCASAPTGDEVKSALLNRGATYIDVPIARAGMNPFRDLATVVGLTRVMRRIKPDVVLSYNVKPIVYGTLAGWLAGVPRRVAMVEGLGYAFTEGGELRRRIARGVSSLLYRIPAQLAQAMIVLNEDDRKFFAERFMHGRLDRLHVLPGIGVDLDEFKPEPLPEGPTTFIMIARLLRDKGVYEYAEAARLVRAKHPETRFLLVGGFDPNPTGVRRDEVDAWVRDGRLEYIGEVDDVRPWLKQAHVLVLPSYREGMPRTVMEAMAMGRPCIVTDVPGCRDCVVDELNGAVVEARNVQALAAAIAKPAESASEIARLSAAAVSEARARFDAARLAHRASAFVCG